MCDTEYIKERYELLVSYQSNVGIARMLIDPGVGLEGCGEVLSEEDAAFIASISDQLSVLFDRLGPYVRQCSNQLTAKRRRTGPDLRNPFP